MVPAGVHSNMTDRSEELTESREPASTDDLLEETERLLSGSGGADQVDDHAAGEPLEASDSRAGSAQPSSDAEPGATATRSGSRLGRLTPSVSAGDLFSPKAFLAFVLVLGAGLLAGNTVIPLAGIGGLIGAFGVAFLAGLATSKRRYLELSTAGAVAGGVTSLLTTDLMVALAVSLEMPLLIGAAVGLVASLAGYYFGRDLRNGLFRDIE